MQSVEDAAEDKILLVFGVFLISTSLFTLFH